jgi:hypothetical protein
LAASRNIFLPLTDASRGGWFVYFPQAMVYWASGAMAVEFGLLCHSEHLFEVGKH